MRQHHALGFAHCARRVQHREILRIVVGHVRHSAAGPSRHQIFKLEDPVVVPQILVAHRDHVLQIGQVSQQLLEALQEVHRAPLLDGDDTTHFGVPQLIAQIVHAELRTDGDQHGAKPRGRQGGNDPLDAVGQVHGDTIAAAQTEFGQRGRQAGRVGVHLLVRPCPVPCRGQRARGMFLRALADERGKGPRGCHLTPGSGTAT
jgi:hypothetical protein